MTDRQTPLPLRERLGPWPEATVAMFEDLGLAEDEIARHLRIDPTTVRHLRKRAALPDVLPPWFDAPDPRPLDPPPLDPPPPDPLPPDPPPRRWGRRWRGRLKAWLERLCRRLG